MAHEFIDSVLEKMVSGETASPVSSHLGMRLTAFDRGSAEYEMTVSQDVTNAMGVLQGGIVTTLADAAMAAASMTVLTDEEVVKEAVTTAQLNSRFMRSVQAGETLTAAAKVVRSGRQLVWLTCQVRSGDKQVGEFDAVGIRVPFDAGAMVTAEQQ